MKIEKLVYIFSFIMFTGVYAQNKKTVDVQEETKVKTIKTEKNGKVIEKKIKEKTLQTQEVKLDPKNRYNLNSNRLDTPVKVEKTVMVDNDRDAKYETKTKVSYYKHKATNYTFIQDPKGFIVSVKNGDKDVDFGKARYSAKNMNYILTTDEYTGVGYFDKNKTFIVEYYDGESDGLITREFKVMK